MLEKNKKKSFIDTGSPKRGEPVFLAIGILRKPHGIKGEMVMEILTDFPERVAQGKKVYLGEGFDLFNIRSVRGSNDGLLVQFDQIKNREDAQKLSNKVVYVRSDEIPNQLVSGFYHHQVIGLVVYRLDNIKLGIIAEIITTGSNDVYVIRPDDKSKNEILLPAISSVILAIDLKKGIMIVNPPEWG